MVDLSVKLHKLTLKNPVLTASWMLNIVGFQNKGTRLFKYFIIVNMHGLIVDE
jgi:hypothetical protein